MRTDDIYFMNVTMDALGCRRSEWAYYLGNGWKAWTPFHIKRLQAMIKKRIDLLRRDGKVSKALLDMADTWQRVSDRIEQATHFEERLLEHRTSMTLEQLRSLASKNETTVQAIEKSCRHLGWTRGKVQGKVIWKART